MVWLLEISTFNISDYRLLQLIEYMEEKTNVARKEEILYYSYISLILY